MMWWRRSLSRRLRNNPWVGAIVTALMVALLSVAPTLLLPIALAYRALCAQFPPLTLLTFHAPLLPLALLVSVVGLALATGTWAGSTRLALTVRLNRRLQRDGGATPPALLRIGYEIGIANRLTYLERPEPVACCYGFVRPRIAVTAGLIARLDDAELTAVLAHERQHLRRRDPLRYLALHALAAAAFMFPVAPALKRRFEAQIELSADRAALAVASDGALAGALLAVLAAAQAPMLGAANLTATEARIAHLSGAPRLPEVPVRYTVASFGLVVVVALASINLGAAADIVRMTCALCPNIA